jgi:hypothetical protein
LRTSRKAINAENTRSENAKTVVAMALRWRSARTAARILAAMPSAWMASEASPAATASSCESWRMGVLPP